MRRCGLLWGLIFLLCASGTTQAGASGPAPAGDSGYTLSITGLVKQPLILDAQRLKTMSQVELKHNGVTQNGDFKGVFWLRGVPLRNLLELVTIEKPSGGFHKLTDLAIVAKSRDGRQVALSWGEVFHRNPGETIVALSSQPVMPKKNCAKCHEPEVYKPWMSQLGRQVGLPKLVVSGDLYSDRSLEDLVSIEVMSLGASDWGSKMKKLWSPDFELVAPGYAPKRFTSLPGLPRTTVDALHVGEGKGFHGRNLFGGVALKDLLTSQKIKGDLNTVYLVSSPDGYRSLLSYGEMFLSPSGGRIVLADKDGGKPIDTNGRFLLAFPGDLWADRWVKAVGKIQAVSLAPKPGLSVIGVGCGDNDLLTLRALSRIRQADVLVVPADIQKRFAFYLKGKPVLFDPMKVGKKPFTKHGKHKDAETQAQREEAQKKSADRIKAEIAQGRSVAVLDWGDPMVYGSARWLNDFFAKGEISYVAGLSAFNVGSAALARDITCKGAVVISDPFTIMKKPALIKSLAADGATLVVFMGMPKFEQVMTAVAKAYGPDTPVNLVLRAGYQRQKVLRGRLGGLDELSAKIKERWLGVIIIGPCLQ